MSSHTKPIRFRMFNILLNPFVIYILRSPFHRFLSGALLVITYRGRRTGKEYRIPVQYVQAKGSLLVIPGDHKNKTWWRNFKTSMPVRVFLRGASLSCTGEIIDFQRNPNGAKDALAVYLERFPAVARFHRVKRSHDGSWNREDLSSLAATLPVLQMIISSESSGESK